MTDVLERVNIDNGDRRTTVNSGAVFTPGVVWDGDTWERFTQSAAAPFSLYRRFVPLADLTPNEPYTASVEVANDGAESIVLGFDWCDTPGQSFTLAPGERRRISVTGTRAYDSTYRFADISLNVANGTFLCREWLIERGTEVRPFFDGSTPPPATPDKRWASSWTGTAGASTSVARVVDRVSPDLSGAPRALVMFGALNPGASTLTLYRTVDGRTMEVRGGVRLAAGEPFAMDYEVAQGVLNSWRAEMFAADGTSLGFTEPLSADIPDTGLAWLQNPLQPETAIPVRVAIKTMDAVERPVQGQTVWAEGAYTARIIGGARRGITGLGVRIYVEEADLAAVDAMLGGHDEQTPPVLLLRTAPPWRLPRVFFMGVTSVREFQHGRYALAGFEYTVTEAQPPFPGLVKPLLRRMDIDAAYPTRAARAAAYASRLARDTDYSLAGVAG